MIANLPPLLLASYLWIYTFRSCKSWSCKSNGLFPTLSDARTQRPFTIKLRAQKVLRSLEIAGEVVGELGELGAADSALLKQRSEEFLAALQVGLLAKRPRTAFESGHICRHESSASIAGSSKKGRKEQYQTSPGSQT